MLYRIGSSLLRAGGGGFWRSPSGGGGGAGEWGGRTPTHYVAPFASVSGASSDSDERGATAWANATNPLTPTTLFTALTRATAGNIIGVAAGSYTVPQNPAGNANYIIPSMNPANSGSSGNPIIFQAQWPAIGPYAEALRSKLSNGWSTTSSSATATFGATGRSYIEWDGFWCDEAVSMPTHDGGNGWDHGPALLINGTGLFMRRCRIDGVRINRDGTNHPGINCENVISGGVHSNYVDNFRGSLGSSVNQCGIQMWSCRGFTVYNNWVDDCDTGIYPKDDNDGSGFGGIDIRYNIVSNCDTGIRIHDPSSRSELTNYIVQNIIRDCSGLGVFQNTGGEPDAPRDWQILNNTFVDCAGGAIEINFQSTDARVLEDTIYRDNLIDGCLQFLRIWDTQTTIDVWKAEGFTASHNCVRGTTRYARITSTNYDNSSIASFHSATGLGAGGQAFSTGATIFEDRANDDYHLAVGSPALTASSTAGPIGAYITGSETIGLETA